MSAEFSRDQFEGREYYCLADGIVSNDHWAKSPVRVINLLKQPKESEHWLARGAWEKAEDVARGASSCPGQRRNLWANIMRWNAAAKRVLSGEAVSWPDFEGVSGPSAELADALRSSALFNLDDTYPIGLYRRASRDHRQFAKMALHCADRQIPRILRATWPDGNNPNLPCVVLCCGAGIYRLFGELVATRGAEVSKDRLLVPKQGYCGRECPVIDWYHPSCRKRSRKLLDDLCGAIRTVFRR